MDAERGETLDALQKLKSDLAQLQEAASTLAADYAGAEKAARALVLNETQKVTVTLALNRAQEAVDKLKKAAVRARDMAQPLAAGDRSTLEGLGQGRAAVQQAAEMSQEAQRTVEAAVAAIQSASALPQLTVEILESIVDCLWPDNNMPYVVNYYYQTGQRLNAPPSRGRSRQRRR